MFESNKLYYMTSAVAEELDEEHQVYIVNYIRYHQEQLTDYLQVFEFYIEDNKQWLIQRQEEPNRETTILVQLNNKKPINRIIWVMDQGDRSCNVPFSGRLLI
ncbi:hypothetical protein IMZ08_07385 [Bacillus luteolus]|uniref:Uncharacterized protein n=1 Tax=Litchfieldia luteola TaxID=682179 RepID=A0ABR9QHA5_9BACI|nr:DUF960 family protein [Cytobacillus luteolus]MBE4907875.1 hypothetical protein [Cytobacillus luteolus]MBP1943967.1 hypothetical protein [Cytobacillus luteolus]